MKTYPDQTFEKAARDAGAHVACLWQVPGPKHTSIAWMEALAVHGAVAIVQTYKGGGWDVYTAHPSNTASGSIEDALTRCGIVRPA